MGRDAVSPLLQALYERRSADAEAILAGGPELDVHEAAAVGDVDRLRDLTETDPELVRAVAPDGFTPLHLAAFFARPGAVRLLLGRGADPGSVAVNEMQVTPLHSAAAAGDRESMRMLLEARADPNARQRGGFTAMDAAEASGDQEMAQMLLASGADPPAAT
jgi:adenosylhomocysteine nucleosidase